MARTTRDFILKNHNVDQARNHIMTWFQKNGFRVLTENSTGEIWEFGLKLIGKVRLYTNIGTIVAINYSQRGIFVMELSLYPHKDSTIVQVQIYIPCGGFLKGNEWDLDPSRLIGQHARLRGLFYLKDFEKYLMTNRKELYQSDLDAMVNYGKFFMFFIITTPRLILSIIGLIFALLPFLLPVLPYQYDRFIIGILFLYMVSPLILIPCISNIIAYLIHNKKLQNKYLFNRFFTLGLMYLLTLFLSFLIYSLFYASRGDPFISYYMTWFLIMLLIYGLIYTSLSHKLFPRVSGITRLWTDEDFIVPLTIPI